MAYFMMLFQLHIFVALNGRRIVTDFGAEGRKDVEGSSMSLLKLYPNRDE
jgi:hypothetical protein